MREIWKRICGHAPSEPEIATSLSSTGHTRDEIDDAVLDVLIRAPFHGSYLKSIAKLQADLVEIEQMLNWAETIEDRNVRDSYIRWLKHFSNQHRNTIESLKVENAPERVRQLEQMEALQEQKRQRTQEVVATLPKPPQL